MHFSHKEVLLEKYELFSSQDPQEIELRQVMHPVMKLLQAVHSPSGFLK